MLLVESTNGWLRATALAVMGAGAPQVPLLQTTELTTAPVVDA